MFRFARYAALAMCASAAIAAGARADVVAGSATFSDSSNSNDLTVYDAFGGTGPNGGNFSIGNVNLGGSAQTFSDFLTLATNISFGGSSPTTDAISVAFNITQPGSGSGSIGGSVTESVTAHGLFDTYSGRVTWADPLTIALSNNENLVINLADTTLSSGLFTCGLFYQACGSMDATFQLTAGSTPVPEPASLALLGTGLFGIGFIRRRRAG